MTEREREREREREGRGERERKSGLIMKTDRWIYIDRYSQIKS